MPRWVAAADPSRRSAGRPTRRRRRSPARAALVTRGPSPRREHLRDRRRRRGRPLGRSPRGRAGARPSRRPCSWRRRSRLPRRCRMPCTRRRAHRADRRGTDDHGGRGAQRGAAGERGAHAAPGGRAASVAPAWHESRRRRGIARTATRGTTVGMYLENLCLDAHDPATLGRFWEALLGGTTLTTSPTPSRRGSRCAGGPALDLCLQRVPEPVTPSPRLHLDLAGGPARPRSSSGPSGSAPATSTSVRATCRGSCSPTPRATRSASWRSGRSTPPRGRSPPCPSTAPTRPATRRSGPSCPGGGPWRPAMPAALRHPSGRGPAARAVPGARAQGDRAKNRLHLDIRLEQGDDADAVVAPGRRAGGPRAAPRRGASCRGGSSPTPRATSCACCRPAAPERPVTRSEHGRATSVDWPAAHRRPTAAGRAPPTDPKDHPCSAPTRPAPCVPPTPARPSPSPGGWRSGVTTGAWPSSTCATRAASCRSWRATRC